MKKQIKWFWAHRRNASLHHMSFFGAGLRGRGFVPVCDFYFDHQIYYGVPGKGCYIFYDHNQLSQADLYRRVQTSVDHNIKFIEEFRSISDKLFGAVFFYLDKISESNLDLLSDQEISLLYNGFISAVTAGPILTVQLWGIEALLQPEYIIIKHLKKKLKQWGKEDELQSYKEKLLINTGESVAYSEQRDFFRVAAGLFHNKKVFRIFKTHSLQQIARELSNYPRENRWIEAHINKYSWVNSEYVSGAWSKQDWLKLFKESLQNPTPPTKKLSKLIGDFNSAARARQQLIKKLKPSTDVRHAIECLSEFIAQRDWSKGYFAKSLLIYRRLLAEIAWRLGETEESILNYHFEELGQAMINKIALPKKIIALRKNQGFIILNKSGSRRIVQGAANITRTLKQEGIEDPTKRINNKDWKIRGLIANKGKITGRAKVLENSNEIDSFKKGEILVTYMTTMEFTPVFRKAAAVITDEGGMSSHAAIVSREFSLPCIVGTKTATRLIKSGDLINVDAIKGVITKL